MTSQILHPITPSSAKSYNCVFNLLILLSIFQTTVKDELEKIVSESLNCLLIEESISQCDLDTFLLSYLLCH